MSTPQFKVGDYVKVIDGSCSMNGEVCVVTGIRVGGHINFKNEQTKETCFEPSEKLQLFAKSFDNLVAGDVLLDEDGDNVTVLAVLGQLMALSEYGSPDTFGSWSTIEGIKQDYTIKGQTTELVELTVAQIAEKIGISAETLRIKD